MELLERGSYLDDLAKHYTQVEQGTGYTLFLMGEAGIGKTSLVNHFLKTVQSSSIVYSGACDSLFTPRPLGPLLDIAGQIGPDFIDLLRNEKDRALIFAAVLQQVAASQKPVVLVFEDIHWADEATIDLIKFLARRVYRHPCLFLLTYREDEIHARHPLSGVFGELPPGHFSKVLLTRFSQQVVQELATQKGHDSGQQLFDLTGGNPFYVMEILVNKRARIPERVKDSVLTVFYSKSATTRAMWEFLSILPSRIDLEVVKRIERDFPNEMDACVASGVIVQRPDHLAFKHELYRLAIEESLSPSRRKSLHRQVLAMMQEGTADSSTLSQLVHHARYADEKELVAQLAPQAAREAAAVGAHREAATLYSTAIDYTDPHDPALAELYEHYAYECYLTYQLATAITSQERALALWRERKVSLKEGDTLRFLSRLWWFAGNRQKAIAFAQQAIDVLEMGFPTRERALAYSNLSQLSMLADDVENTLRWGNQAIDLAIRMEDPEIASHALNNVGTALLKHPATESQGEEKLQESLSIALANGFHEHIARAYVNMVSTFLYIRKYEKSLCALEAGYPYCEERDLDFLKYYMLNCKARFLLETGKWKEAETIARRLQPNPHHLLVKVGTLVTLARLVMRRGNFEEARLLLAEGKTIAMPTHEAQRIIPVLTAELELAWLSGCAVPLNEVREAEKTLFYEKNHSWEYTELAYWMHKCGLPETDGPELNFIGPFQLERAGNWQAAAEAWQQIGCPYEQALALFEGEERHKKQALLVLNELGATATHEMLKAKLKGNGVRNIPRGPHESTRNNPAQLTGRQIEILLLLREGAPNKEIADKLFISPKTVDHHITAILAKLEVNSRSKAVLEAHKIGILK